MFPDLEAAKKKLSWLYVSNLHFYLNFWMKCMKKLFPLSFKSRYLRKDSVCLPLIIHDLFEKEFHGPPFWLLAMPFHLNIQRILHKSTKDRANTFAVASTFYFIKCWTKVLYGQSFLFSHRNSLRKNEQRVDFLCK